MKSLSALLVLWALACPIRANAQDSAILEDAYKTWKDSVAESGEGPDEYGVPRNWHIDGRVNPLDGSKTPTITVEDISVHWTGDGSITCDRVRRGAENAHELIAEQKEVTEDLNAIDPNDHNAIARAEKLKQRLQELTSEIEKIYPKRFDEPQIAVEYILKSDDIFGKLYIENGRVVNGQKLQTWVKPYELEIQRVSTNGYHWGPQEREAGIPLTDRWGHATYPVVAVGDNATLFTRNMSPIEMCLGDNSITFEGELTFEIRDFYDTGWVSCYTSYVKKSLVLTVPNQDYNSLLHDDRSNINKGKNDCLMNEPFHLFCDH